MSKLFRALAEMIEGNSEVVQGKTRNPEMLKKSEFKTLIQKEWSPSKRTRKYKHTKILHDSDTEPMNESEPEAQMC